MSLIFFVPIRGFLSWPGGSDTLVAILPDLLVLICASYVSRRQSTSKAYQIVID